MSITELKNFITKLPVFITKLSAFVTKLSAFITNISMFIIKLSTFIMDFLTLAANRPRVGPFGAAAGAGSPRGMPVTLPAALGPHRLPAVVSDQSSVRKTLVGKPAPL